MSDKWNLWNTEIGGWALKEDFDSKEAALEGGRDLIRYWTERGHKNRYVPIKTQGGA